MSGGLYGSCFTPCVFAIAFQVLMIDPEIVMAQ